MANVLKGGSAVMLSLLSSRSTTLSRTTTHCSFLPKFPFFSLSSSSRSKTPSGFSSFCTHSSEPVTVTEAIAVETNVENDNKSSIKDVAGLLDIRVGQIVRAWKHDEAESLYVEEVDIGENEPRIICSGLVNYIPLENLQVYLFFFFFSLFF
jgi:aminoacyl tRNA synthase complex-interacting multifunctional protein 1